MRGWFQGVLLVAVGIATTLMVSLVAAEFAYTGVSKPLAALAREGARHAMLVSLMTSTIAAGLAVLLAVPCAYALSRWRTRGLWLIDALLDIPIIMSPMALGVAMLLFFQTRPGTWLTTYICEFVFELPGIVLGQFLLAFALAVRVMRATFADVDVRLEQVARSLGCSPWQSFRYVALPLGRNGVLAGFILGWARAIGDFGVTVMIGGSARRYETVPIRIYHSVQSISMDEAVALTIGLTMVALFALVIVRLVSTRRF